MNRGIAARTSESLTTRIFRCRDLLTFPAGFIAAIAVSNALVMFICERVVEFDCPPYWPISLFSFRMATGKRFLLAVAVLLLFHFVVRHLVGTRFKLSQVIPLGIVLVLCTSLFQGWNRAFVTPIVGTRYELPYYLDAVKITDAVSFFRDFGRIQPNLLCHSATHPPGAVLAMYVLANVVGEPAYMSIVIGVLSVYISAFFLYGVLSTAFDDRLSGYVSLLFLLIPSIQIYYVATLDALIAASLLGVLYYSVHPRAPVAIAGSVVFLFLTSFLTFGFVFAVPIIFGVELVTRRTVWRSALAILGLVVIWALLGGVLGYDYIGSFATASVLENPGGFRLLSEPVNYVFTRIEGICEILLFFGPFLSVLMIRGIRALRAKPVLFAMTCLAVSTLLAMLAAGAFKTAETARVCLFIYPYLVFPIASYLADIGVSPREETILLHLVFVQTWLMQLFGTYIF